ncbi:glycerol-3-phosphate 1-O-acyltransferase PlsY [Sulfuritalea hydrogenivorans]|jgi:glycerol-3-phosphate acyltransferase PlsY|uniref:Glycerol-3-phosphate acyltransferase n=1 Tax=Sulfuritalea hydrogenivorans sk43H TaxID=1223802 RepID=W0SMI8_9PROT|nr:glycerol-3-phosphate 1-O-acyltransferase PlsY [Sulfuritalea hydrogenivorans]MDK9713505.1 glycerol-3-phosphate 1-O-acyltransferase PlsY [Sulfuritalea sp.]BAO31023.1 putative glycerol-3-phosphate acyltransferase PlsY [Sulfuritalea hydrogenivorans sk43H]
MNLLVSAVLGYLLGSIPFAVIVSRAFRLADPRSFGSGNPGATNVLRSGSKAAALLTLIGDAAKGWLAMFIAQRVGAGETAIAVAGLAAFLGHVFPFTLGFKGGKGVATALGVLLGFSGVLAGITAGIWIAVVIFTRYSSLAALAAAAAAPALTWWLLGRSEVIAAVALMCAVLIYRHKSNIRKLVAGTESRIGGRKRSVES